MVGSSRLTCDMRKETTSNRPLFKRRNCSILDPGNVHGRVAGLGVDPGALGQFDRAPILAACDLLADAKVDAILWSGTNAGWMGFEADHALCRAIEDRTGIAACTSVLALNEVFEATGVRRFGLVTPYLDAIQERILATYAKAGLACVAERHLNDRGNFSFFEYGEERLAGMIREVAAAKPDAIAVFCTNLRGASVVGAMERETGIPVYDTVATGVWKAMRLAGADPARVRGWGRLFKQA